MYFASSLSLSTFLLLGCQFASAQNANACTSSYLTSAIAIPNNGTVINVAASAVSNAAVGTSTVSYCNVTITYTHPGMNDTVNLYVNLPLSNSSWNGRFQGVGGGGWATSSGPASLTAQVALGYTAGNTDGGHVGGANSATWAYEGNGVVNYGLLEDFSYIALGDLGVVGKQITTRYYGTAPKYSYWNGCSTGGRQGLMLAQRYPTLFNGIYAGSPAIHFETFQVAQYWGQYLMNQLNHYPPQCVFNTITAAAVAACDDLDGVTDGVIGALSKCHFDARTLIGTPANCTGFSYTITANDTYLAQKIWQGPRSAKNKLLWYGINPGAAFSGLSGTSCNVTVPTKCTNAPFAISTDWSVTWVFKDPSYDMTTLNFTQYEDIFPRSFEEYTDIIGTEDTDLSAFKANGGKMISWHGLADQLIYPQGTELYYKAVLSLDPNAGDFYRFFPAPGVAHCGGGAGAAPNSPFDAVVSWVETGVAPDTLPATSTTGFTRNLCLWPKVQQYVSGDPNNATSYKCGTKWTNVYNEDYFNTGKEPGQ